MRFGPRRIIERALGEAAIDIHSLEQPGSCVGRALGQHLLINVDVIMVFTGVLAGGGQRFREANQHDTKGRWDDNGRILGDKTERGKRE